jgi:RimJ/RimL family protein N-acetyltransferase
LRQPFGDDEPMANLIGTDRLNLVRIREADAEEMAAVLGDPDLYRFIGGTAPTTGELRERYRAWIAGPSSARETWHNWTIRLRFEGDRPIGHLQATVLEDGRRADIAWVIGRRWQGRGYASEAAKALVGWLGANGVASVTAHIHPDHVASGRVAAHAGLAATDEVEGGERIWRLDVGPAGAPTDEGQLS